jgi:hypothetical protein
MFVTTEGSWIALLPAPLVMLALLVALAYCAAAPPDRP